MFLIAVPKKEKISFGKHGIQSTFAKFNSGCSVCLCSGLKFWIEISITLFYWKCVIFSSFSFKINIHPVPLTHIVNFLFVCYWASLSLFYSHIAICFLSQIWYFWVFFSILWFLCTAVLPTIDKLSLSVISIVFITRGWYSDLGMPIILFWWKLPCYWGRLWVFHFQLDGTFHFLVQGYSDVDAVGDGLYCAFDYYYALLDYQMRFLHLTASSSRDWFWLPVNLGLK